MQPWVSDLASLSLSFPLGKMATTSRSCSGFNETVKVALAQNLSLQRILVILCIILMLLSDPCHTIVNPPSLLLAPTFVFKPNDLGSLQLWVRGQLCRTSSTRGMKDEVPCDAGEERTCSKAKAHCLCLLPTPELQIPFSGLILLTVPHGSQFSALPYGPAGPPKPHPRQASPSSLRAHPGSHLWPVREIGEAEVESLEILLDQREERGASRSQTPNPGRLGC